jgi:hypothetical protein
MISFLLVNHPNMRNNLRVCVHTQNLIIFIMKYMNTGNNNFSIKADTLFLIVVGQKNALEQLLNNVNKTQTSEKLILTKINCPSSHRSIELMKELNNMEDINMLDSNTQKTVLIDDGTEFAQGYVYADGDYNDTHYILQLLTEHPDHYVLSFIKFVLDEDDNPENLIEDWFKKRVGKIPSSVKKSIKLITVAGSKSNILVVSTELKKAIC